MSWELRSFDKHRFVRQMLRIFHIINPFAVLFIRAKQKCGIVTGICGTILYAKIYTPDLNKSYVIARAFLYTLG
jgi:hypothetical protein